ncbi:hypothetical protein [Vibrio mediterranei]|uniref:hypothetical protein n=1 Tax=Vibrio mediterranei TaxID=689 RepID=UPI0040696C3E
MSNERKFVCTGRLSKDVVKTGLIYGINHDAAAQKFALELLIGADKDSHKDVYIHSVVDEKLDYRTNYWFPVETLKLQTR